MKIKVLYIVRGGDLYGDNRSMLQSIIAMLDHVEPFVCMLNEGLYAEELKKHHIPYKVILNTMSPKSYFIGERKCFSRLFRFPVYIVKSIISFYQLIKVARFFRPDIVSSNNSFIYAGVYLSRKINVPHVWHLREYVDKDHNKQMPRKDFFERNIRNSHCVSVSKGLFDYRKLTQPKDTYIYNGVFSQKEMPPYYPDKEDYFLYLGRVVRTKGVSEMVSCFIDFSKRFDSKMKLMIAGEGPKEYVSELTNTIHSAEMGDRVVFLPFHKDIRPLLVRAKALIVPSYFEAYGRITPEALLCGCFVIGHNTGGTREILENINAGLPYNSDEELVDAMKCVAQMSNADLGKLNKAAMHKAATLYTCEKNASDMLGFYHKILNK